jgi:hypothetical protein
MARGVVDRLWRSLALSSLAVGLVACDSELVRLGRLAETEPPAATGGAPGAIGLTFASPVQRAELGVADEKDDNATLTADALLVYFTSTRGDRSEVYTARRAALDQAFGTPTLVELVNDGEESSSPAISLDGSTLWLGKSRESDDEEPDIDIWEATRESPEGLFTMLRNVSSLNSPAKDIPRPAAGSGQLMPLSSQRADPARDYRIYFASRPSADQEFGAPVPVPELDLGQRVVDGFLTEDLLMIFFSSGIGEDEGDLWVARRASADEPFAPPVLLDALNTEHDERDPWLSPDRTRFFFTSDRFGDHEIFESIVRPD